MASTALCVVLIIMIVLDLSGPYDAARLDLTAAVNRVVDEACTRLISERIMICSLDAMELTLLMVLLRAARD